MTALAADHSQRPERDAPAIESVSCRAGSDQRLVRRARAGHPRERALDRGDRAHVRSDRPCRARRSGSGRGAVREHICRRRADHRHRDESLRAERARAVDRARELEQLQEATAELARAQTANEVVDVVLGRGLRAIGATAWLFREVRRWCRRGSARAGYPPDVEARLVGPATDLPLIERAVKTGTPVWLRSSRRTGNTSATSTSVGARAGRHGAVVWLHPAAIRRRHHRRARSRVRRSGDRREEPPRRSHSCYERVGRGAWRARSYDAERIAEKAETLAAARADVRRRRGARSSGTRSVSSARAPVSPRRAGVARAAAKDARGH